MVVRQSFAVLTGVILGVIIGYTVAGAKTSDEPRIASIIRDEVRDLGDKLSAPRSCEESRTVQWPAQPTDSRDLVELGTPRLAARLDELKTGQDELRESLRRVATQLDQRPTSEQSADGGYDAQIAASDVEALLSNAISTGNWTTGDEQRYYGLVQQLRPHERIEALKRLSAAINSGQIRQQ